MWGLFHPYLGRKILGIRIWGEKFLAEVLRRGRQLSEWKYCLLGQLSEWKYCLLEDNILALRRESC
jgi:hypothetical protein